MIPMPPSHCVNWRQMPSERLISSKSVTTLAPVVVKPDMPSKYASSGLESCSPPSKRYGIEANAAASSHVDRDDEESLADADAPGRIRRQRARARSPTPLVTDARDDERAERLPVPERERDGEERGEAEVLPEHPDEVGDGGDVDRESPRAADPRDGLTSTHSASTTHGAFAASVKMITRSPASSTSSPCGKIAAPLRTIAPMIEPCTGMSRNAMPM